jgi:DNA invertase Pin-like site-specific DNA recombinase
MKAREVAYSYLRFSHPDQAKGDSLRRQKDLRDAWLARNKNVVLDTALTLEDEGVSGFTGEHRSNPDRHALAAFLALVKQGRIARGSYLIVENLDRLSREDIIPALSLLLNLIESGIRVVQLLPVEMVYDAQSNPMNLMMAIMELSRGHSESVMKSERVGGAWQDKKRRAAANGEPVTKRVPYWLRVVDGKFEVIDSAAETVRRIFRMAIDGHGIAAITKRLNADRVPVFGPAVTKAGKPRPNHWPRSYVAKILANRAVLGEYQPFKGRAAKRKPDGKPIPDYYPRIITDQEWYAARGSMARRKGKVGRPPSARLNVFAGLLFDARDGGSVQLMNKVNPSKGVKDNYLLASAKGILGVPGCKAVSFPFDTFERAILSCLREVKPRDVLPRRGREDKTVVLSGRLAEVEAEIEKLKARLQNKYTDAVADVLERQEATRQELGEQLAQARQEAASPLGETWGAFRSLVDVLDNAPNPEENRVRLRVALRRMVEGIWCLFVARGATRLAAVQVRFQDDGHRDYLILHRPATGGFMKKQPASSRVASLTSKEHPDIANLDLRRRKDALALERVLLELDVARLGQP